MNVLTVPTAAAAIVNVVVVAIVVAVIVVAVLVVVVLLRVNAGFIINPPKP